ncbi:MAG TPA: hypothetical protein VGJ78_04950, partial [Vicinamibacterales bacterium]
NQQNRGSPEKCHCSSPEISIRVFPVGVSHVPPGTNPWLQLVTTSVFVTLYQKLTSTLNLT